MKKITYKIFFSFLFFFILSIAYYNFFSIYLEQDQFTNILGFTRVVIPDTFIYKSVLDDTSNIFQSIIISSVKNTIGPSLIWALVLKNWTIVILFNTLILLISIKRLIRIAKILNLNYSYLNLVFIILFLPITLYFSIGSLKEIPCFFGLISFFYFYIKRNNFKLLLYFFFLFIFRYQLAFPLLCFIIFDNFKLNILYFSVLFLSITSIFYPLFSFNILANDATAIFREGSETNSNLGTIIENIRSTIPGLSFIAIIFRCIQTIYEPLFTFYKTFSFMEDNSLNIFSLFQFISTIILFPIWFIFFKKIIIILKDKFTYERNIIRLYSFCILFIIPTAGFSFIQTRYLYPIIGLLILATLNPFKPIKKDFKFK